MHKRRHFFIIPNVPLLVPITVESLNLKTKSFVSGYYYHMLSRLVDPKLKYHNKFAPYANTHPIS